jgi:hypothetical protein
LLLRFLRVAKTRKHEATRNGNNQTLLRFHNITSLTMFSYAGGVFSAD